MTVAIKVPSVGESVSEGTLARWLKKEGTYVKTGEPVLELETEKATTEVPAPASGVLTISVPEGKTVAVGEAVGQIDEKAGQPAAEGAPVKKEEKSQAAGVDGNSQEKRPEK